MYTLSEINEVTPAGDCSGWEKDPQSFAKRVGDHYLRTVLNLSLMARTIRPPQAGSVRWEVVYPNDIVIAVIFANGFVAAARIYPWGPIRHYDYSCTPQGDIVLTDRPLPSSGASTLFPGSSSRLRRRSLAGFQLGEGPAAPPRCSNTLDARAQAIIRAAQNQSVPLATRAVQAVRSIINTYFASQAGLVTNVVYEEAISGLMTQRSGWGPGATGVISVGRYFTEHISNFARRVLQTGHELVHIEQYRQNMQDQTEREFLAHCWTALMPEIQGTGCVRPADRVSMANCSLRFFNCLAADVQRRYAQHQRTLLTLRQAYGVTAAAPAGCNRDEIRQTC